MPDDVSSNVHQALSISFNKPNNSDTLFNTSYPVYFTGDTLSFFVEFTEDLKIRNFSSKISLVYADYRIPVVNLFEKKYPEFRGKKAISLLDQFIIPTSVEEFSDEGNAYFKFDVSIEFQSYPGHRIHKGNQFWVLTCEEFPNHCTNVNED